MKTVIFADKFDKNSVVFLDSVIEHYRSYGHNEFYLLCGENFDIIENWLNTQFYRINASIIYCGKEPTTGKMLSEAEEYIEEETFLLVYAPRFLRVNINEAIKYHKSNGKVATLTSFMTGNEGNYAVFSYENGKLNSEKKKTVINAGFMVLEAEAIEYIKDKKETFEKDTIIKIAENDEVDVYRYYSFAEKENRIAEKNIQIQ